MPELLAVSEEEQDRIVKQLLEERRFCFVIMPYKSDALLYNMVRDVIHESTGRLCIRADEVPGSGQPLLDKVHKLIERAEVVLAILPEMRNETELSPNVYYEIGYAAAKNPSNIAIICHEETEVPTDLRGLEKISYTDKQEGIAQFKQQLQKQIRWLLDVDRELVRSMLLPHNRLRGYLLANPRGAIVEDCEEKLLERFTHGDNLGVWGVLSGLGAILDTEDRPELISSRTAHPDLMKEDNNLYLIGSPRTTPMTEWAMKELQRDEPVSEHRWCFPDFRNPDEGTLTGRLRRGPFSKTVKRNEPFPTEDWGIILRGPRPQGQHGCIWVFAGIRSFGTGGACLAATSPQLIKTLAESIRGEILSAFDRTIWALVRVRPDESKQARLTEEDVSIEDAGIVGEHG